MANEETPPAFSPSQHHRHLMTEIEMSLSYDGGDSKQWQRRLRNKLRKLLGNVPAERVPLDVKHILSQGLVALAVSLCMSITVQADVQMPALFTDHMVLQRDIPIPVWGWAAPSETVTVTFAGQSVTTKAGKDKKWRVVLKALPAKATPQVLVVEGKNRIEISDVLVGDVWLCSGQSNMWLGVGSCLNPESERMSATLPAIRHFKVHSEQYLVPARDVRGGWQVASPNTVGCWTAVGYFFGRDLHRCLNVPIGLINSSVGATRIETWISREKLAVVPGTTGDLKQLEAMKASDRAAKTASFRTEFRKLEALETDKEHILKYSDPSLKDADWKQIETPANWESVGHPDLNGEVWYRRTVDIPAAWEGKGLTLSLGPIDEIDTTYFNGVRVGGLGSVKPLVDAYWHVPRNYRVPASLVEAGRAVIAMRIVDQEAAGGPWGGLAADMFIAPTDSVKDVNARLPLSGKWRYHITFELAQKPESYVNTATVNYNGMIAGLIPYGIRGAIWYQGEANAGTGAYAYRDRFPAMIKDWRDRWQQGDFPFLWVQLANYRKAPLKPEDSGWAVLRESQNKTLSLPNTGTALAIDVGDAKDIHPRNKQAVGKRLALVARAVAYGETLVYAGPTYKSMTVEGKLVRIHFDHIGSGLKAKGGELKHFAIAGEDQTFVWAKATIEGDTVVVKAGEIPAPVAVRYAWATNPEGCNLYNQEGLPANPFRTDTWPVSSQRSEAR